MKVVRKRESSFKDEFEKLYLKYFLYRKIEKPASEESILKFKAIAQNTAARNYKKYRFTYVKVGFDEECVENIAINYLYLYLSIHWIHNDESKMQSAIEKFIRHKGRKPSMEELDKRERNLMINFINQQLVQCVTSCSRKSRNIVVSKEDKIALAMTENSILVDRSIIIENPKKYGYRVLNRKEMLAIKKSNLMLDKDGFPVFEVFNYSQIPCSFLTHFDKDSDGWNDEEIIHSSLTPSIEDQILEREDEQELVEKKDRFDKMNSAQKKIMLRRALKSESTDAETRKFARNLLNQLNNDIIVNNAQVN